MKKRLTAMILAMVLGAGVLAGCGGAAKQESTPAAGTEETAEAAGAAETRSIKVTWVHYSGVPADMQEVTDAVNAITVPEIGVEVEFVPMSLGDTMTKYTTMIASNERMDLMLLLFQDPLQYYSNGSLEPLNDLMSQYGTTIQGLSEQFPILAVSAEGETYGVAPVDQYYGTRQRNPSRCPGSSAAVAAWPRAPDFWKSPGTDPQGCTESRGTAAPP